jgi:hypothetical protein
MLRNWTRNKVLIANQKRGSRQSRIGGYKGKEDRMERGLFAEFKAARKTGKAIGS